MTEPSPRSGRESLGSRSTVAKALARFARARVSERILQTPAADDQQTRKVRLLLPAKGVVSAHRLERPLTAELDDEEQSARHGSALAADRSRAWNSIAKVALLRLPRGDSAV